MDLRTTPVPEIRARMSSTKRPALSASYIPDYSTFLDFMKQYRTKISEVHFQEALCFLWALLLKDRVGRSSSLPLYYCPLHKRIQTDC